MRVLFLALFFLTSAFAQDYLYLTEEELNPSTEDVLIKRPEKHLRHESMIYDLNTDLGIKDQRQFTGGDRNRISLSGHISSDYEHLRDILGADLTYMRRTSRYNQIWWGFQFFQHATYFDAITENQSVEAGDGPTDESSFQRPGNVKNRVMAGGLGVGYRFKLLLDFFPTEDMFENIDVFGNYLMLEEDFIDKKYSGYGLTTSYGIHKRTSTSFYYGSKISYNVASVTRPAIGGESRRNRSLTLGWLSWALELGFFY